jgi:hypothetical protein
MWALVLDSCGIVTVWDGIAYPIVRFARIATVVPQPEAGNSGRSC